MIDNKSTARTCLGALALPVVVLALAGCATTSYASGSGDGRSELLAAHLAAINGEQITAESRRAVEDRIRRSIPTGSATRTCVTTSRPDRRRASFSFMAALSAST